VTNHCAYIIFYILRREHYTLYVYAYWFYKHKYIFFMLYPPTRYRGQKGHSKSLTCIHICEHMYVSLEMSLWTIVVFLDSARFHWAFWKTADKIIMCRRNVVWGAGLSLAKSAFIYALAFRKNTNHNKYNRLPLRLAWYEILKNRCPQTVFLQHRYTCSAYDNIVQ